MWYLRVHDSCKAQQLQAFLESAQGGSKRYWDITLQDYKSAACLLHSDVKALLWLRQVRPVHSGTATLKDATSEAIRDWVTNVETTHYILGSAAGPHPYPMIVRDFQAVIGEETRRQCQAAFGGKPDILLACVGGGSNAIGLFHEVCGSSQIMHG